MNFSIEQLLAFVTVYDQLSFSKAAVKLNKHRTTIGQVIGNLEDQLAVTLFERIGRSVEPTEDGHLLYHYAKQTLEQARVFDKVALSLSYGGLESITIACSPLIPVGAMAALRQKLITDFPSMRVNCILKDKSEIKKGIESGEIHFGLVNIHESRAIHSFDATFLGHIELIPFVQKGSDILDMEYTDAVNQLKQDRQFLLKSLVDEGLKEKLLFSANYEEVETVSLIVKFIKEGMGWAWLPKILELSESSREFIQPVGGKESGLRQGFKFPIALWCPHSKQISDIKKSLIAAIHDYVDNVY
ncbi:LysR family transcriptional regulator [Vibrio astriarenae]|uniref:LysR family transcriptional regulator n=1 Tax=Vibrio astriarenae TaxID=1481923 RepID=A0A7Z2T7H3_9VIBR|nr:LysR family transcriptional regulator [Vibrio astriarenae]QIA65697.1 LysR family transcriptional regulator [Vibrio astriarenae]